MCYKFDGIYTFGSNVQCTLNVVREKVCWAKLEKLFAHMIIKLNMFIFVENYFNFELYILRQRNEQTKFRATLAQNIEMFVCIWYTENRKVMPCDANAGQLLKQNILRKLKINKNFSGPNWHFIKKIKLNAITHCFFFFSNCSLRYVACQTNFI